MPELEAKVLLDLTADELEKEWCLPKTGAVLLTGDAVHFKENWESRRVPSFNVNQEQTVASLERIADILDKEKAQLWINHDKAQRDSLKLAPEHFD